MVYPHFLAPLPSMAVVQFQPSLSEARSPSAIACGWQRAAQPARARRDDRREYRTAHDVSLYPVELAAAAYVPYTRDLNIVQDVGIRDVKAAVHFKLRRRPA